ncbi:MAG: autotransporter outer membrane beta-barrel domain-containing protein, partial [Pseudomonadota bacterium]
DGATVTDVQLNSIAATGFGPDIAFAGAIPVAGSGTFAATVGGVTVIDLDAIGPFTEDFVLEAASPTGTLPDTIAFDAPLFTSLSFAETPFGSTAIAGDFLLDGSVPLSPNSEVVADYLTGQIAAGSLSDANVESLDLISLTELDAGLLSLSPEPFAAAGVSTVVAHTESITNVLTDRFDRAADEMGIEDPRFVTWGNVYGIFADVDSIGDDVFSGYGSDGYGFVSGVDARVLPGLRLGLFTGYADSDVDFDRLAAGADVETYHIGGYGTLAFDRFNISSWVAYAFGDVEANRDAGLVGLPDATADYDADQFIASTEISYRYPFRDVAWVEPQLRAVYIHVDGESFTESGAPGLALDVETENINIFLLEPELRVGTEYEAFGLNFMPEVTIGYSVDVIDEKNSATARLVGAGPETFTVAGVPRDDNAFLASAGVTTAITPRITTFLHYDGRFGEDGTDHGVKGGLQFSF